MCVLTRNQIKVLELFSRGVSKSEINRITGLSMSSINEALKRGQRNIDKALETLETVVDKGLLSSSQVARLQRICQKI